MVFDSPQLFAGRSKLGLSPQDQQKYDELMRSARTNEIIGYVAAGAGLLVIVVAVLLKIYSARKKKSRTSALRANIQRNDGADSLQHKSVRGQESQG
jgi:hypothetical protein